MEKFLAAVRNMFNVPDLRRRIFFTLGLLAVYRLGAHIGAPGINKTRLDEVWRDVAGTLLGVLDLFSGGNFRTISIFALGVTPYITASIILQLMTVVSPQLKKLQEEGEMGRQKINQWTRYLTVALAAIQTSFVAHWLQVNGVGAPTWGFLFGMLIALILIIAFIVFVEAARRKIPVSYAKRHVGRQVVGGQQTTMPLKINMGGVIPVIFASSVLSMPQSVFAAFPPDPANQNTWWATIWRGFQLFHPGNPYYELIFLSLIVFFTFFYVSIVFNVEEVADNLRKHGGFMPGIRPGRATAKYLNTIMTRLTTVGAVYLALVAFVPQFMLSGFQIARLPFIGTQLDAWITSIPGLSWIPTGMGYQFYFGGTSLLILVGVAMDTVAQIEAQLVMRNYEGFLGTGGRLRGRRA